jgi:hypothetical protein
MFTIENHLEALSHLDDNCKTIYSIWNLNKKNLKRALSTIQITFPHYSIHDYSHADTIIQNIELYLGESRIKSLSVTDAWLILMSAYTHDIGMIVFMKDLEDKINTKEFVEELELKANNKYDYDLAEASKLILRLLPQTKSSIESILKDDFNLSYALQIKRAITLLSADLFRKIHHEQSKKILQGMNESFENEFNKFYSSDIPVRFLQILGDIAYSHGIDFYETMDLLPQKSNGYASDYMHPRFIAYLLRLGDLLDVDDKRFNQFTTKVFDKESVKLSKQHEQKHASVKHLLVTPESIEITVDCKEDETVYRIANQWFDYLKEEIENQSREWSKIRPEYLSGLAPSFSRNKIQVLFNGKMADTDLMNLQFNISKEKTFEIFEGSALYDDPSYVFLREITQNAVDATKIQLWKDIEKGVYDILIKQHFKNEYNIDTQLWEHDEVVQNIIFPTDIPLELYENYEVKLSIDWETIKNEENLTVTIKDKGCGINKSTLIRMCNNVGDSRNNDKQFQEIKKRIPFFLKPTGAFGLGLQSIFLVTDEFEVKTKNEDDKGWDIIFRSAKKGQYISAVQTIEKRNTGTSIKIKIPKSKLPQLFSNNEYEIDDYYDTFNDTKGSPVIWQMIFFSKDYLLKQRFLKLNVIGIPIKPDDFNSNRNRHSYEGQIINFQPFFKERSINEKLLVSVGVYEITSDYMFSTKEKHLGFKIFEELHPKSGTEISIQFIDSFDEYNYNYRHFQFPTFRSLYSVRDIGIKDGVRNLYDTIYSRININFLNPESDKLLNIARSRLIKKTLREFMTIFRSNILKEILINVKSLIEKNFDDLKDVIDLKEKSLSIIYFHIHLTFQINGLISQEYAFDNKYYRGLTFPEHLISLYESNFEKCKLIEASYFFNLKKIIINLAEGREVKKILEINSHQEEYNDYEYDNISKLKDAYRKLNKNEIATKTPISWYVGHISVYLDEKYSIKSLLISCQHSLIYGAELMLISPDTYYSIDLTNDEKVVYFNKYFYKNDFQENNRRKVFHPISPYASEIAVKESNKENVNFQSYTNHAIISPFVNYAEFYNLKYELRDLISEDNRYKLIDIITNKYIDQIINKKFIQYIIDNASMAVSPNSTSIKHSYSELITDLILFTPNISTDTDPLQVHFQISI